MNLYQLGTQVELRSAFTASDGVTPIDPDEVTLLIRDPAGTVTTYDIGDLTHVSEGVFTFDVLVDQSGPWIYNFTGSGNIEVSSGDQYLDVAQSAVVAG